jgi:hypothetical protein
MAVTEAYAGTQSVDATEWSLTTDTSGPDVATAAGAYQVYLDLSALLLGDVFELRGYEKVQSTDTQRVFMVASFANAQGTDGAIAVSPVFMLLNGWDFTLKMYAGSARTITWSIRKAG